jgi:hypothetical protein
VCVCVQLVHVSCSHVRMCVCMCAPGSCVMCQHGCASEVVNVLSVHV